MMGCFFSPEKGRCSKGCFFCPSIILIGVFLLLELANLWLRMICFLLFLFVCVCVFFFPFPKFFQCCCTFRFWVCWGGVCFKVSGLAVKSNRFFMDVRALNFGRGNTQYVVELMNWCYGNTIFRFVPLLACRFAAWVSILLDCVSCSWGSWACFYII